MRHLWIVLGTAFFLSGCLAGADSEGEQVDEFLTSIRVLNDEAKSVDLLAEGSDYEVVSVGSPEHGQLEVDGSLITYTPTPGFAGEDAVSYQVSQDGRQQQVMLNIDVVQQVTIVGRVFDQPIPYAQVTTEYAGEQLQTEADAQGFYELTFDVQDLELDDALIVKARGVSRVAQEDVSLQSIIMPPARLLSVMDEQRQVRREQLNDVQITQLSTAYSAMVLREAPGATTLSQHEVDRRSQQLDPDQLIHMAGVVRLLVDDSAFRLPQGYAHVLELLQDERGYQDYLNSLLQDGQPGKELTEAVTHTLQDDQVMPQMQGSDWTGSYLLTQPVHSRYTPMHRQLGWKFITLNDAGDGQASSDNHEAHTLQWTSNSSRAQINLVQPREQKFEVSPREAFAHMPNWEELLRLWGDLNVPVTVTLAINEVQLVPLREQSVFAPVVAQESGYFKAFEFTRRGEQWQVDARSFAGSQGTYLMSDRGQVATQPDYFEEQPIVGHWALGLTPAGGEHGLGEADIFRFYSNGSFNSEFQQLTGDWAVSQEDGSLTLNFANGYQENWQVSFQTDEMASALVRTQNSNMASEELRVMLPVTPGSISPRLFINSAQELQVIASDFLHPGLYNTEGQLQAHPDWRGYQIDVDNRGFTASFTCGQSLTLYRPWCQSNFRYQVEAHLTWSQEADEMKMNIEDYSHLCHGGDCLEQRWRPLAVAGQDESFVVLEWQRLLVEVEDNEEGLESGWHLLESPQLKVVTPRPLP